MAHECGDERRVCRVAFQTLHTARHTETRRRKERRRGECLTARQRVRRGDTDPLARRDSCRSLSDLGMPVGASAELIHPSRLASTEGDQCGVQ